MWPRSNVTRKKHSCRRSALHKSLAVSSASTPSPKASLASLKKAPTSLKTTAKLTFLTNKSSLTPGQVTIAIGRPIFRWKFRAEAIATEGRALGKTITNKYTNMKDPRHRVSSGSSHNLSSNPKRPEPSHLMHPTGSTLGAWLPNRSYSSATAAQ